MKIIGNTVQIPVRELVEYVLRSGNISASFVSGARAIEGTRAHKKLQDEAEGNYEKEVKLTFQTTIEEITYSVEGRADGIITDLVGVTVDEIKSTRTNLDQIGEDYNPLHWAQAKCYAYFYATQNNLKDIGVRLTYYNLDTKKIKYLNKQYTQEALETFYHEVLHKYHQWIHFYLEWLKIGKEHLKNLKFPFENYRAGQRELAVDVYQSIKRSQNLYINAPTGVGKTLSTLFPTLKAMGEGLVGKIFYLTAKTITRTVAEKSLQLMYDQGVRIKSITLTAKDKICFCEERKCHPEFCKYAEGHFDRVDQAVQEALKAHDLFSREIIEQYAKKFCVCPFEMALDLAIYVDVVICDYNYVFDPTVSLKRFLHQNDFVFLVDEAHNLVERGREMYSESIQEEEIIHIKKRIKKTYPTIAKTLVDIEAYFLKVKEDIVDEIGYKMSEEPPQTLSRLCRKFIQECDQKLQQGAMHKLPQDLLELYFRAVNFNKIYELYDTHYTTYAVQTNEGFIEKMFCIDPSYLINEMIAGGRSVVYFSATLQPIEYFRYMLGGQEDRAITIPSPFDTKRSMKLIARDVSTRYRHRERSYKQIVAYIEELVQAQVGNYLIFFPSYKYMREVYLQFKAQVNETYEIQLQEGNMNEEEREKFLQAFEHNPKRTTIGFCVLGGIFSEGIDLVGTRLIGTVIVGVGLPQIGLEKNLIQQYFDERQKEGYHYAYTYPGMNKVLQAMGRVIRTEKDYGVILLIDDRYYQPIYQQLIPEEYQNYVPTTLKSIEQSITQFWEEHRTSARV